MDQISKQVAAEPDGSQRREHALLLAQGLNPYSGKRLNAQPAVFRAKVDQQEMQHQNFRSRVENCVTRYFAGATRLPRRIIRDNLRIALGSEGRELLRGLLDIDYIGRSVVVFLMKAEVAEKITAAFAKNSVTVIENFDPLDVSHLKRPDIPDHEKTARAKQMAMERLSRFLAQTRDLALVTHTLGEAKKSAMSSDDIQQIIDRGKELAKRSKGKQPVRV
jgi:hypothetical protein